MQVSFNDVPGGVATLQTTYTNCTTTAANGQSRVLTVYIRSVTNVALGSLTLNGSTSGGIEFGSADPVTLEVAPLAIPRNAGEPNPVTLFVEGYEWTIPAGWLWPDGAVSTGAARLFNARSVANPNNIRVTPPANACGNGPQVVRVRAVDTECSLGAQAGYAPTRSAEKTLTVNCILPTLRIASNGAPNPITCGDRTDYGFRAETQGGQPGGTFTYDWTASNGWTPPLSAAQVPGILPSGNTGTTLTLGGTYSRSGISVGLARVELKIEYSNQVATPAITSPAAQPYGAAYTMCGPTVFTATAGAQSYRWTTTWGDDFVTTTNTATITPPPSPTGPGYASGYGTVQVRAQNPGFGCTDSAPAGYYVVYGPPSPYAITYDDHDLCNTGLVAFEIFDAVPAGYQWSISGGGGTLRFGSTGNRVLVYVRDRNGSFSLSVVPTNACGTTNVYEYQAGTFYCADFDYTCGTSAGRVALAPNPATDEVLVQLDNAAAEAPARPQDARPAKGPAAHTLPVRRLGAATPAPGRGEYVAHLYDRFGREVKTGLTRGGQLRLSVAALPAGTYWLRAVRGAEVVSRQLLVQH